MFDSGASEPTGPLKGIRVLDWTIWQFGPMSASMMGDMGADVIKIEALDGDAGRALARATTLAPTLPEGRNAYFETNNRNKRGIAVNLKTPEGRRIVYRLVETADVFIQNFRHGVAERLEVDYDTLHAINPMLVYGSATGYGPNGPDAALPSFDGCGQARSGLMLSATPAGWDEPVRIAQGVSDQMGAIMLCQGVLAALVARHVQGVGQKVEASHLSSNMWLQGMGMTMSLILNNRQFGAYDRKSAWNVLANIYKCKDGRWIQLQHLQPDRYWESFMSALGLPRVGKRPQVLESRGQDRKSGGACRDHERAVHAENGVRVGPSLPRDRRLHLRDGTIGQRSRGRSSGDSQRLHHYLRPPRNRPDQDVQPSEHLQRDPVRHLQGSP